MTKLMRQYRQEAINGSTIGERSKRGERSVTRRAERIAKSVLEGGREDKSVARIIQRMEETAVDRISGRGTEEEGCVEMSANAGEGTVAGGNGGGKIGRRCIVKGGESLVEQGVEHAEQWVEEGIDEGKEEGIEQRVAKEIDRIERGIEEGKEEIEEGVERGVGIAPQPTPAQPHRPQIQRRKLITTQESEQDTAPDMVTGQGHTGRIAADRVISALKAEQGMITYAAKRLGVSYAVLKKYINTNQRIQQALIEIEEYLLSARTSLT